MFKILNKKKNITFVIFSRANYNSIKSIILELKKNKNFFNYNIIVGASAVGKKFGNIVNLIRSDGFKVDYEINNEVESIGLASMVKTTALGMMELSEIFKKMKTDLVFTVGDRYETMATAITASYMNIPLAHTMGGEVTGTIDESIRHAITKMSHLHFVSNKDSYERVLKLGEKKKKVFNVGCPRNDLLKKIIDDKSKLVASLKKVCKFGVGDIDEIKKDEKFLIVLQHSVTTEFELSSKQMVETLKAVNQIDLKKIILWPNADAGYEEISTEIRKYRENNKFKNYRIIKNLPIEIYAHLLNTTSCIIGNSSSAIRDGSFLGTPAVNIGTRQNLRLRGLNVINTSYNKFKILKAINHQISKKKYRRSYLYGSGHAAKKIVKILKNIKKIEIQKTITY
jgi:UDP-hydrolysing UDP-N-acetyl-D-glucosamine 2-epimerase